MAVLAAPGCTGPSSDRASDPVRVIAAFYPLAFAAERLGGAAVEVRDLTPPGVEPHDLELTADDLEAIAEADVVVYLGGGFQPAIEDAVSSEASGAVIDVAEGLPIRDGDPHVWLDPALYGRIVEQIAARSRTPGWTRRRRGTRSRGRSPTWITASPTGSPAAEATCS